MRSNGTCRVLFSSTIAVALLSFTGCVPGGGGEQTYQSGGLNSDGCPTSDTNAKPISIAELLSTPAVHDGQLVQVDGYYYLGFEHSAIYPTPRDPRTTPLNDGIWVDGLPPSSQLSGHRVSIRGVFSSTRKGHLSLWPASLCVSSVAQIAGSN